MGDYHYLPLSGSKKNLGELKSVEFISFYYIC